MADTVFSAKIDEDVKAKFEAGAQATGTSQKEFFSRLVTFYETAQARESVSQVKEIEQLRHHLARVEEIYIGLVKGGQDQQEADANRINLAENDAMRTKAHVTELTEKLDSVIEQAKTGMDAVRAEAALIRETASKDVQDMKDALIRTQEAQQQSARLATLAEESATTAKVRCTELEGAAARAEGYRQDAELAKTELAQLRANTEREIANMRDVMAKMAERAEIEQEKAVLTVQRESMNEIGRLREELAQAREELSGVKAALEIATR